MASARECGFDRRWVLACIAVAGVMAACSCGRAPQSPAKVAPAVVLHVVRIDDSVDPFGDKASLVLPAGGSLRSELPSPLPNAAAVDSTKTRYLRFELQPGEMADGVWLRAQEWARGAHLPADCRLGFGALVDAGHHGPATFVGVRSYVLKGEPIMTNDDIARSEAVADTDHGALESDGAYLSITLHDAGSERLRLATAGWLGRRIAIVLDGKVMSAPVVHGEIAGGQVRITIASSGTDSASSIAEARRLALALGG